MVIYVSSCFLKSPSIPVHGDAQVMPRNFGLQSQK